MKMSRVKRKFLILLIVALFSSTTCAGVAFGATGKSFSLSASPGRVSDSAIENKENSKMYATVSVQRYIEQTDGRYLYIRVRRGTSDAGACTEKKIIEATGDYNLSYTCFDINERYYLRSMTDETATVGYTVLTGVWTP